MISSRLKAFRLKKHLKANKFAALIGISQGAYSDLENAKSDPSAETLGKMVLNTEINIDWLLTGKGSMERKTGQDSEISQEIRVDPKLLDVFKLLQDDREARDMVYEILVGKKQVERVAKIVKKLLSRKIEDLMQADLKEDPMLVDIMRILAANPATKHTIYKFLETDMNCARSLEIFKKHFEDKFAEKSDPPPENSAGL